MISTTAQQPVTLRLKLVVHKSDSEAIPKQVLVMNSELIQINSFWINSNETELKLSPGVYIVRVSLTSGKRVDKAVEVVDGKENLIEIDISSFSPRENQEWAYFTKSSAGTNPRRKSESSRRSSTTKTPLYGISARLWYLENNVWSFEDITKLQNAFIDEEGWSEIFDTPKKMELLQVYGGNVTPLCVMLPPCSSVRCLVKLAEGPPQVVHPLDITVSTLNYQAESLLALITSGAMGKAKSLCNVEQAEGLLYNKMADPAAAAIGGYYLLKIGELKRRQDWAYNLANRFDWLPDGAIIYASQLMQSENEIQVDEIRKWLVIAAKRGIPVYSEGLRLLYEGLMTLWFDYGKEDGELESSLQIIKKYVEHTDFSQETTTFTGKSPTEPGAEKRRRL